MRKGLLIILAVIFVTAISSCTKEYVTPAAGNTNKTVVAKNVGANTWVFSSLDHAYTTDILVPDLDDYYNEVGAVLVYFSFTSGKYEQIPNVYDGVSYSFTHSKGKVTLFAQTVNGQPFQPSDNMNVKIVLIDSND